MKRKSHNYPLVLLLIKSVQVTHHIYHSPIRHQYYNQIIKWKCLMVVKYKTYTKLWLVMMVYFVIYKCHKVKYVITGCYTKINIMKLQMTIIQVVYGKSVLVQQIAATGQSACLDTPLLLVLDKWTSSCSELCSQSGLSTRVRCHSCTVAGQCLGNVSNLAQYTRSTVVTLQDTVSTLVKYRQNTLRSHLWHCNYPITAMIRTLLVHCQASFKVLSECHQTSIKELYGNSST